MVEDIGGEYFLMRNSGFPVEILISRKISSRVRLSFLSGNNYFKNGNENTVLPLLCTLREMKIIEFQSPDFFFCEGQFWFVNTCHI